MSTTEGRNRTVEVTCPDIAEGNVSAAISIRNQLTDSGCDVLYNLLTVSSFPAQLFHRFMTSAGKLDEVYTSTADNSMRQLGLPVMGLLSKAELLIRHMLHNQGSRPDSLIAVQEHQFGAFTKGELQRKYPFGVKLFIPDVFPKESAVSIMRNLSITPVVWNTEALEYLKQQGMQAILAAPFIISGFSEPNDPPRAAEDYIMVKSSGSGIKKEYLDHVHQALNALGCHYMIYLPDTILTEEGSFSRGDTKEERIANFYRQMQQHPPKGFFGYPSESVMNTTKLPHTVFVTFKPRGRHESRNYDWGSRHGVVHDYVISPETRPADIAFLCKELLLAPQYSRPDLQDKVGSTPFTQIIAKGFDLSTQFIPAVA